MSRRSHAISRRAVLGGATSLLAGGVLAAPSGRAARSRPARDPAHFVLVILVGHSAGGPVISTVAEARPAAVAKLVYLTAYLLENGASIVSTVPRDPDSLAVPNLVGTSDGLFVRLDRVREIFYGTTDDADVALARTLLKPIGLRTTFDPVRVGAAFESVRRFYVECRRDRAVTPGFQRAMHTALPCERVFAIRSDHSPFFSRPGALVRILEAIARA